MKRLSPAKLMQNDSPNKSPNKIGALNFDLKRMRAEDEDSPKLRVR